jgi:TfoX/Sxy family transcriptional regulator of competence genes
LPWEKANKVLIQLLEKTVVKYPCDRRMMFGSPTFFINNNMFAGVHEDTVILRLADEDRAALYAAHKEASPFTPMPSRPMKEYAALPESLCKNAAVFNDLLDRSFKYALTLPAKPARRKKK